jgi:hypothetical protein
MNEYLIEQLKALVEGAKSVGADAADFIAKQAPDIATQLVTLRIWQGAVVVVLYVALGIAVYMFSRKMVEKYHNSTCGGIWFLVVVLSFFYITSASFDAIPKINKAITGLVAPKILLIEELSELTRGKK